MRNVSINEFMSYAVSEVDAPLYNAWANGDLPYIDIDAIFKRTVILMFIAEETGSVADYVREIASAYSQGAMQWVK
jgi:hypothetical protein